MKPPKDWEETIDGKRYSTKTAVLIARGVDEHIYDPLDWNIFLYRTPEGYYFKVHLEPSHRTQRLIEPVDRVAALNLFGALAEQCIDLEDAFPDRTEGRPLV